MRWRGKKEVEPRVLRMTVFGYTALGGWWDAKYLSSWQDGNTTRFIRSIDDAEEALRSCEWVNTASGRVRSSAIVRLEERWS